MIWVEIELVVITINNFEKIKFIINVDFSNFRYI